MYVHCAWIASKIKLGLVHTHVCVFAAKTLNTTSRISQDCQHICRIAR